MSAVQLSPQISECGIPMTPTFDQLSSSQQLVLCAVALVQNLQGEEDVQCLLFLADEFGALRSNPFYFSTQRFDDQALPCSLVLRDTLRLLFESGVIGVVDGRLTVQQFARQAIEAAGHTALAVWLAALSAVERCALAAAVLELRAQGVTMRARAAVAPFRQTLDRALGVEGAELLEHRLNALRWQPAGI